MRRSLGISKQKNDEKAQYDLKRAFGAVSVAPVTIGLNTVSAGQPQTIRTRTSIAGTSSSPLAQQQQVSFPIDPEAGLHIKTFCRIPSKPGVPQAEPRPNFRHNTVLSFAASVPNTEASDKFVEGTTRDSGGSTDDDTEPRQDLFEGYIVNSHNTSAVYNITRGDLDAESLHVQPNISVNRFINLVKDTTSTVGRKMIEYWFKSTKPLPACPYERSLCGTGMGFPLWDPLDVYNVNGPTSPQENAVAIGAVIVFRENDPVCIEPYGYYGPGQGTAQWEKLTASQNTGFGAGHVLRSKSYKLKGNTFWSSIDPYAGGLIYLRAGLFARDAEKRARKEIGMKALNYFKDTGMASEWTRNQRNIEDVRPYFVTGYNFTTSCILAAHYSLHKVGFTFMAKDKPQTKPPKPLVWKELEWSGGSQTKLYSSPVGIALFLRGYRVEIRPTIRRFHNKPSVNELDDILKAGNIRLKTLRRQAVEQENGYVLRPKGGADDDNTPGHGDTVHHMRGKARFPDGRYHPSDVINKFKIQFLYREAAAVATHDDEWLSLIRPGDDEPLPDHILINRWIDAALSGNIFPELNVGIYYHFDDTVHTYIRTEPFPRSNDVPESRRSIEWRIALCIAGQEPVVLGYRKFKLTPERLTHPSTLQARLGWAIQIEPPGQKASSNQGSRTIAEIFGPLHDLDASDRSARIDKPFSSGRAAIPISWNIELLGDGGVIEVLDAGKIEAEAPFAPLHGQQRVAEIQWDIHRFEEHERDIIAQGQYTVFVRQKREDKQSAPLT